MTDFPIMRLHFNTADYPYDYELEIWKNAGPETCLFYIREVVDTTTTHFDQFLTVGQTLRLIHTGKADTNYTSAAVSFRRSMFWTCGGRNWWIQDRYFPSNSTSPFPKNVKIKICKVELAGLVYVFSTRDGP